MYEWNNVNSWMPNNNMTYNNYPRQMPHYEIVKVNGQAGANAFQMAPNSSIFLADATNPNLIWLVQTDGAGYSTSTALDVSIHQEKPQPNLSNLEERVKHLEDMYDKFNSGFNKQPKKQYSNSGNTANQKSDAANAE